MKARVNRGVPLNSGKYQEEQKVKAVKSELQAMENKFAKLVGFKPREVVYAPYDRNAKREEMIDYLTNRYYSINAEENLTIEQFRQEVIKQMSSQIEKQLDFEERGDTAYFKVQFPDKVFLFSNTLKHNMVLGEHFLTHESLHAAIYDLVRGYISGLSYYESERYDSNFLRNVLLENKMKPLISNRNHTILNDIVAKNNLPSPELVFQFYSYEEDFVMFNTLCHIMEQEFKADNVSYEKLIYLISIYCGSAGMGVKSHINNEKVELYGKKIPLEQYIGNYLDILRGSVSSYDETDKSLVGVVEPLNTDHTRFRKIDSQIPELVDKISGFVQTYGFREKEIRQMILDGYMKIKNSSTKSYQ